MQTAAVSECRRFLARSVLFNVLGMLALPLAVHALFLYWSSQTYFISLPVQTDQPLGVTIEVETAATSVLRYTVEVAGSPDVQEARFQLPQLRTPLLAFHLRPTAGGKPASAVFGALQVISDASDALSWKTNIAPVPAARLAGLRDIAAVTPTKGGAVRVDFEPGAPDPLCVASLPQPLEQPFNTAAFAVRLGIDIGAWLALGLLAAIFCQRNARASEWSRRVEQSFAVAADRVEAFCRARPRAAIWLVALVGVVVSCYPILFCGRSLVSPNNSLHLLYAQVATLPGSPDNVPGSNQGSDVTATMAALVPWTVTQRNALLRDGEFPLWNRHDAGGIPLLGQGMSMIGDPLHWLVIVANSNAWAWDLHYMLAKVLFAAGLGLIVRLATRCLPAALLTTLSSCFISFFVFRLNHPTYFVMCYAPWVLLAWVQLARGGGAMRIFGLLVLSNWMVLNSGGPKEASILMLEINACGLLALLGSTELNWTRKRRILAQLVFAGVGFALISAPVWLTFLSDLARAWNTYQKPSAWQIQPALLVGFFDDIFYREFNQSLMLAPGVNFVALLGIAFALGRWRALVQDRTFAALSVCALGTAAIVFGVVPPSWLAATPFIGQIIHTDSTFSYPLIIFTLVLAGFGFREGWQRLGARDWPMDVLGASMTLGVLLALCAGLAQAWQVTIFNPARALREMHFSTFSLVYAGTLVAGFIGLPIVLRALWRDRSVRLPGGTALLLLCLGVLLWRHGLQAPSLSANNIMCPTVRVPLVARSPAVERLRGLQSAEPGRSMGIGDHLAPGFSAVWDLESPSGADALQNRFYHGLLEGSGLHYLYNWFLVAERPTFPAQRKFLDVLNVRYYLEAPTFAATTPLHLVGRYDLDVYQSDTAWPRAFFTDSTASYQKPGEFYQQIAAGDGRPFASLDHADTSAGPAKAAAALPHNDTARQVVNATDYRLTNHTTSFRVHAPSPGVIVLLEGYMADGIEITVNGQPAPHFRVDAAFTGIHVPAAGAYSVRVNYWPPHLTLSLWLAALGAGLLTAGATWEYRRGVSARPVLATPELSAAVVTQITAGA